jgi:hypothetical protein
LEEGSGDCSVVNVDRMSAVNGKVLLVIIQDDICLLHLCFGVYAGIRAVDVFYLLLRVVVL